MERMWYRFAYRYKSNSFADNHGHDQSISVIHENGSTLFNAAMNG